MTATQPLRSQAAGRLASIDALRGWIMAVMAIDHASAFIAHRHSAEFWAGELTAYSSAFAFLTRFITHFCAPGFFFLMGTGMALFAASRARAGWSKSRVTTSLVKRGLLLVLLNQILENPAWIAGILFQRGAPAEPAIVVPGGGSQPYLFLTVLSALGLVMACWAWLVQESSYWCILVSVSAIAVSNVLIPSPEHVATIYSPLLRILLIPGHSNFLLVIYPVLPWLGVAGFGIVFGRWLLRDARAAYRAAPWIGVAFIAVALSLRALGGFGNIRLPRDGTWIEFLNFVKYPPALVFILFMLGANLILLAVFNRTGGRILAVYGRTPLFFYIAHLYLYSFAGLFLFRNGLSLQWMYAVWLAGLVPLYFLCDWFRRFKERKPAESVWRLF